jgi:hypothetical protein
MACVYVKLPNGATAIVCGVRTQPKKCVSCRRPADRECDFCDRPICSACSTRFGDIDGCPDHRYEVQEREAIQSEARS